MSCFSRFQSSALWEHYLGSTHTVQRPDNRLYLKIAAGATGIRELEVRLAAVLAALGARAMESPIPFVATGFTAYHHPQRENNSRVINPQLLKISVEFSLTQAQKYLLSFVLTGNPNPNTKWSSDKLYWPKFGRDAIELVFNTTMYRCV